MAERPSKLSSEHPTPLDLPAFLPYACSQNQAPFELRVIMQLQSDYVSATIEDKPKRGKSSKSTSRTLELPLKCDDSMSAASRLSQGRYVIVLTAVYDSGGHLVELGISRAPAVPRLLLKIIALCVPFHPALYKFTVRWGPLCGEAVYEMAKILPLSHITEICLDDSPVPEHNYYLLLEEPSQLYSLSLARCSLDDRDAALLAACLLQPRPASRTLYMLNLASNHIADVGAIALANALRSNRTLQYLNLSGNQITDDGAVKLFDALAEFQLTYDELITKRRRQLEHLKTLDELTKKCYAELATAVRAQDELSRTSKRRQTLLSGRSRKMSVDRHTAADAAGTSSGDALMSRAQMMAAELIGGNSGPFSPEDTVSRDERVYSMGNTLLCALNLGYNSLGYASVERLQAVLRYQETLWRRAGTGLVRVVLEGNALPAACPELTDVQELLGHALALRIAKPQKSKQDRKSLFVRVKPKSSDSGGAIFRK